MLELKYVVSEKVLTMLAKNIFKPGDSVKIISLALTGVICSISNDGNAKVAIGSLTLRCKITDLEAHVAKHHDIGKRHDIGKHHDKGIRKKPRSTSRLKSPTSLDLHGYTSKAAKEVLLKFISDSVMSAHPQVSVIHGHGNGTIKRMVHETLSELEFVASFRHPIGNNAETKIYFR